MVLNLLISCEFKATMIISHSTAGLLDRVSGLWKCNSLSHASEKAWVLDAKAISDTIIISQLKKLTAVSQLLPLLSAPVALTVQLRATL